MTITKITPLIASTLLAASLFAGCSNSDSTTESTETSAAAGATSSESTSSADESTTKTVKTAFGDVTIPSKPMKAIALEGGAGPLLSAGFTPIATADGKFEDSFTPEEYKKIADLPVILGPDGFEMEKIAELKPDMMIGFVRGGKPGEPLDDKKKAEFEKLNAIAPTVLLRTDGAAEVKNVAFEMSKLLGADKAAESSKEAYDKKAAEIKSKYSGVLGEKKFAAVDAYKEVTVYSPSSWLGGILTDIGAQIVPLGAEVKDANGAFISFEELGKLDDADIILHESTLDGQPGPGAADLAAKPLWKELPAVKDGHAYGVKYFFADRHETALMVLDQLDEILSKQK